MVQKSSRTTDGMVLLWWNVFKVPVGVLSLVGPRKQLVGRRLVLLSSGFTLVLQRWESPQERRHEDTGVQVEGGVPPAVGEEQNLGTEPSITF